MNERIVDVRPIPQMEFMFDLQRVEIQHLNSCGGAPRATHPYLNENSHHGYGDGASQYRVAGICVAVGVRLYLLILLRC